MQLIYTILGGLGIPTSSIRGILGSLGGISSTRGGLLGLLGAIQSLEYPLSSLGGSILGSPGSLISGIRCISNLTQLAIDGIKLGVVTIDVISKNLW